PIPDPVPLFLVLIMITPSLALDPYKAEAAAPFNTVIDTISSGLIVLKPSPLSEVRLLPLSDVSPLAPKLVLSIGTPLTTIKGELCPPKEDCPRIRILLVPAGPDPKEVILTPANLPCKAFIKLEERLTVISSVSTVAVAYPNVLASLFIPRAVIITSSKACTSG